MRLCFCITSTAVAIVIACGSAFAEWFFHGNAPPAPVAVAVLAVLAAMVAVIGYAFLEDGEP